MVGERIKFEREQHSWSQSELARRSGINQAYISQLERGLRKRASAEILQRIARAFGLTVDDLMGDGSSDDLLFPAAILRAEGLPEAEIARISDLWTQHPDKRKTLIESAHNLAQAHAKLERIASGLHPSDTDI